MSAFRLRIELTNIKGEKLVEERVDLDSLASLYAEFGHRPGGYTTQRFLDTIQSLFLRAAEAPKITIGNDTGA